jgi:hypothetical protein
VSDEITTGDSSSSSVDLAALEYELAAARSQLEDYQNLIDELPAIYEAKFGHRLREVAKEINQMILERNRLQQQINASLLTGGESSLLAVEERRSQPRYGIPGWLRRQPRWKLALAAAAGAGALLLPGGLLLRGLHSPPASTPATTTIADPPALDPGPAEPPQDPQPAVQQLRLRAKGDVWLELRSADQRVLFEGTLTPGQQLTFPLTDGMRIRSGRPHLLELARTDQPFTALGLANDFSWRNLGPSDASTRTVPEAGGDPDRRRNLPGN